MVSLFGVAYVYKVKRERLSFLDAEYRSSNPQNVALPPIRPVPLGATGLTRNEPRVFGSAPGQNHSPSIPGLTAAGFALVFEKLGFETTEKRGYLDVWQCSRTDELVGTSVGAHGLGPEVIVAVTATVLANQSEPTSEVFSRARDFLMSVASLEYKGATPQEASTWVASNFAANRAIRRFGPVSFQLRHTNNVWQLEMIAVPRPNP